MSIGTLRDPAGFEPLVRALADEADPKALAAAVWALGALGDRRAVGPLEKLKSHRDPEVREYVAEALLALRETPKPEKPEKPAKP
jgi:HEAT repeat protein